MTTDDIRTRLAYIEAKGESDDEVAHAAEGDLHQDVLTAIAEGAPNPAELAREALKTGGMTFARWCA